MCPPETRVEIRTPGTCECDLVWKNGVFTDVIKLLLFSCSVMSDSLGPHRLCLVYQAPLSLWDFQARTLEWAAISFSRGSSHFRDQTQVSCIGRQILYHLNHQGSLVVNQVKMRLYWTKVKPLSRVRLLATPWTVAYQAPLSMGFSRQ